MTVSDILVLLLFIVLPAVSIYLFRKVRKKMISDNITNPPVIEYNLVFISYTLLAFIIFKSLAFPDSWSAMESVATFYLIVGAPIAMALIALKHRESRRLSKYHKWAFLSGLLYFIIAPVMFGLIFLFKE